MFRDSSFPSPTSRKSPTNLQTLNQQASKARPCGSSSLPSLKGGREPFLRGGEQRPKGKESAPFLGSLVQGEGSRVPDRVGNGMESLWRWQDLPTRNI